MNDDEFDRLMRRRAANWVREQEATPWTRPSDSARNPNWLRMEHPPTRNPLEEDIPLYDGTDYPPMFEVSDLDIDIMRALFWGEGRATGRRAAHIPFPGVDESDKEYEVTIDLKTKKKVKE